MIHIIYIVQNFCECLCKCWVGVQLISNNLKIIRWCVQSQSEEIQAQDPTGKLIEEYELIGRY